MSTEDSQFIALGGVVGISTGFETRSTTLNVGAAIRGIDTGVFAFGNVSGVNGNGGDTGVHGIGDENGVVGDSADGIGVSGTTSTNHAVFGRSFSIDKSGVYGSNLGDHESGPGVIGNSTNGDGVFGRSQAANKSGVFGFNSAGVFETKGHEQDPGVAFNPKPGGGPGVAGTSTIGTGVVGTGGVTGVFGTRSTGENGFLGGKDPQFEQSAGVYGESAVQGVMGLTTDPSGTGVYGGGRTTANGAQIGVRGETSTGTGVQGTSFDSGIGVQGTSTIGTGVVGTGGATGVIGRTTGFEIGSLGGKDLQFIGVQGTSTVGTGVEGTGGVTGVIGRTTGFEIGFLGGKDLQFGESAGVYGESAAQGVMGLTTDPSGTGVYGGGRTTANGAQIGVRGETSTGTGVQGTSFDSGVGVSGNSEAGIGVAARTNNPSLEGLFATNDAGGLAAFFVGGVRVQGDFTVFGGAKSAAVPHPDGSHRLLYCMESPESWFEDFGEGQLMHGKVDVRLDLDFAALVQVDGCHVFITPYGESKGLFVAERNAAGFRVCEQQGGDSNASFAYRVVAKRKDIVADRLSRVDPPSPRSVGPR